MTLENNQLLRDLTEAEAATVQGGWFFNIPFFMPVMGLTSGGTGPAPTSYEARTTSQNYGFFSAWNASTSGGDYNGISSYLPGVFGWWEAPGTDPRSHNAGALQVFWD